MVAAFLLLKFVKQEEQKPVCCINKEGDSLRCKTNVNYKSRPIKSKAISPIPNYGFNLYNQNQLVEKPRVRYLIQLDSALKIKDELT